MDNGHAEILAPIMQTSLVMPYFITGHFAAAVEEHLFGVYRGGDDYKL